MMDQDYGLWPHVIIISVLLIAFAGSSFHPRSKRDWRAMGAYSAFIVALFTEMYGVPLTIYLLSGWLGSRFPALQATHSGGHLWNDLIGWKADPHFGPFHLASYAVIHSGSSASMTPGVDQSARSAPSTRPPASPKPPAPSAAASSSSWPCSITNESHQSRQYQQ